METTPSETTTEAAFDANVRIGFIGAGNMATAFIEGLLRSKACLPSQISVSYPSATSDRPKFARLGICDETASNEKLVRQSDIVVLCCKPQQLAAVCDGIRGTIDAQRHLVLSVCAGVRLDKLDALLQPQQCQPHTEGGNEKVVRARIARCTLNTAALVGASCAVFSQNGALSVRDKARVRQLLCSVGTCLGELKDADMDAAMAVCACGIAYMYVMADAMADGGVKMGLTRDMALQLATQTMRGAADLMTAERGRKHPMQLKDEVCSPGGTTIQGVHELERNGFRNAVICAVESAANRAKQL